MNCLDLEYSGCKQKRSGLCRIDLYIFIESVLSTAIRTKGTHCRNSRLYRICGITSSTLGDGLRRLYPKLFCGPFKNIEQGKIVFCPIHGRSYMDYLDLA